MLTKKEFVKLMQVLQQLVLKDGYVDTFVKSISEDGKCRGSLLREILLVEELLIEAMEPTVQLTVESLIDYFVFDLEFGRNKIADNIEISDYILTSDTDLSSSEKLYDFLIQHNKTEGDK